MPTVVTLLSAAKITADLVLTATAIVIRPTRRLSYFGGIRHAITPANIYQYGTAGHPLLSAHLYTLTRLRWWGRMRTPHTHGARPLGAGKDAPGGATRHCTGKVGCIWCLTTKRRLSPA